MSKKNETVNTNDEVVNTNTEENKNIPAKKAEVKKERILIPIDPLNKNNTFVPVGINGKIYQVNRGVSVEVPLEVAKILKNAGYIS